MIFSQNFNLISIAVLPFIQQKKNSNGSFWVLQFLCHWIFNNSPFVRIGKFLILLEEYLIKRLLENISALRISCFFHVEGESIDWNLFLAKKLFIKIAFYWDKITHTSSACNIVPILNFFSTLHPFRRFPCRTGLPNDIKFSGWGKVSVNMKKFIFCYASQKVILQTRVLGNLHISYQGQTSLAKNYEIWG